MTTPKTITIPSETLTMQVTSVSVLNVNGGRFAEISYGITGQMSVLLSESDPVASLFASADAEFESARATMRRAMRMQNAAWVLSKERAARFDAKKLSLSLSAA
jgi:hypothetical protein